MLQIVVPDKEYWNEVLEEFTYVKGQTICLEHSLVSLSKWEAKWHKPFLLNFGKDPTFEETRDYYRCMTLTQNVKPDTYYSLSIENVNEINEYIDNPMTATTFKNRNERPSHEIITSELIYYWMVSFNIPFECQKWHLNRLLTLIRVCSIKNEPSKKRSRNEIMLENNALNEARKKQMKTTG